ncbi:MAG: hypothetical protein LBS55_06115 [Prevotellaceae bacterium]|nr:hypothetical protein [Prevotellaceae bacterium]
MEIVAPNQNEEGNIFAIKKMLDANSADNNTIAIAIAEPTSFLVSKKISQKNDVRIIGTLINKPPFWAIDHEADELDAIEDFQKEFDVVIHSGDKYVTGSPMGKRSHGINGGIQFEIADNKEEIEKLSPKSNNAKVALTTDVISIARAEVNGSLKVNFNFSGKKNGFNYITTGILTSKNCCDKYPDILIDIIKVFKKTINDLYMEEGTVKMILEIANEVFGRNITEEEHKIIYKLFNGGRFYDKDFIISKTLWENAVALQMEVHYSMYVTKEEKQEKKRLKKDSFAKYVDNRFAYKANTFPWIRIFLAKHNIKKRTTKTFIAILFLYVLLVGAFIGLGYFVLNLHYVIGISLSSIIIPVILCLIQKFGVDNIKR